MDGAQMGSAAPGGMLTADRIWVRWGVTAAVTGMLAWVVAVALIPLDAKLDKGSQHLAAVLRAHTAQLYVAAGRAFPVVGDRPGLAIGGGAPARDIHPRPARRIRTRRDHRRARPAHHGDLDSRPGRHAAQVLAVSHPRQLRKRRSC
jgi:hypothetical protein